MRGIGEKYDYDKLAYQPVEEKPDDYFLAAPPCRAVLHAADVESRAPSGPISRPAGSLLSTVFGRVGKSGTRRK